MSGKADEFKKQVGADNYAKGLSVVLEKAEVDNRTLLEQLEKAGAELAETRKEYHATRDEVDRWKRLFHKEYESRKIETADSILELCERLEKAEAELADLKEIIESCPICIHHPLAK